VARCIDNHCLSMAAQIQEAWVTLLFATVTLAWAPVTMSSMLIVMLVVVASTAKMSITSI
jgi:hypothetical protein